MMNKFKFPYSLKSKIILLISIILLLLFSVQFFVLQWVRRDVISEMKGITHTINRVSEKYLIDQSRKYDTLMIQLLDSLKQRRPGALHAGFIREKEEHDRIISFSSPGSRQIKIRKLKITGGDSEFILLSEKQKRHTNSEIKPPDTLDEDINVKVIDTLVTVIHSLKKGDTDSVVTRVSAGITPPQWVPAPEVLRFDFEPVSINNVLDDITRKTIWINGIFLLLTLTIIFVVIKTFLKPVEQLGTSIQEVEKGNLNIQADAAGTGELADLSRSFNHMVSELQKSREKEKLLKQREHLAALGQLAAGVAHEVKNPLNAIQLNLQQLESRLQAAEHGKKELMYVRTIFSEISRLEAIVNNMLDFIREQNQQLEPVELNALLVELLELLSMEFKQAGIEISLDADSTVNVNGDRARLKTAFLNILLNALQATPAGGTVLIRLEPTGTVTVVDTGKGIADQQMDRIWDLFYTTRDGGTGLGLPTAYKIFKDHGGNIRIQSRENEGTTVEIQLPIIEVT